MFTALVLDRESRGKLMDRFQGAVPDGWEWACNHMTINLGGPNQGPARCLVGRRFDVNATTLAFDGRVVAVGVQSEVKSVNAWRHITVAINTDGGGKAKHSKELTNWTPLNDGPLVLRGTVQVVN